ncbi:MAG TPA: peptidoglycan-binding domain-containing protein [Ilumatobacteraceae bacterium]|jgi:hypothetical protein
MPHPELRRDSSDTNEVRFLQERLQDVLRNEGIRLSAVDGIFGPITEESVKHLQRQHGLADDGIVNDATWEILDPGSTSSGSSGSTGPATPTTLRMRPLDITVPYQLRIDWDMVTLQQMNLQLSQFSVHTTPNTQLQFLNPVGKLFGAGGIEVLHREVQSWPNWFVDWSTRATIDFSKSAGIQLHLNNQAEIGLRPLRGVSLTAQGNLNLTWRPMDGTGSIQPSGGVYLKINILELLPR